MKLPKGVTVVIGNHTYKEEIPDHLVERDLRKTLDKKKGNESIVEETIEEVTKKKKSN